jgi:hypothetical protein
MFKCELKSFFDIIFKINFILITELKNFNLTMEHVFIYFQNRLYYPTNVQI